MTLKILEHLGIHLLNFSQVTTRHEWEVVRRFRRPHLRYYAAKEPDAFLGGFQFLIRSNHGSSSILTSTMPPLVLSRLICQYAMNSSTVSRRTVDGRTEKTLAPNSSWATRWLYSRCVCSS